jgi:phosphoribosylformylglycinamidine cyclo-ligase
MRPPVPLTYRVRALPAIPEVLEFLVAQAGLDAHAAYMTFNMGAGLALYCRAGEGEEIVRRAREHRLQALLAGAVEAGARQVLLEPLGVRYGGDELELSAPSQARQA